MVKCSFCGKEIEPGTGSQMIKNDGTVLYFHNRKCRVHFLELRRDPKHIKWTEAFRARKGGKK